MTQSIASPILPVPRRRASGRGRTHEIPQQEVESTADASSVAFIELQKRLEAALHEREETIRQRDDLARQLATLAHSTPELNAQLDEARRQLASVRRARDAAQAHGHELTDKVAATEDRVAELEFQLETAERERDTACQRADEFTRERDDLHRAVLDLAEQRAAAVRDQQLHTAALADAQNQLVRISKERDAARATADEEAQAIADLDSKLRALTEEVAVQADSASEIDALRQMIRSLEAEIVRLQTIQHNAAGLSEQLAEAERNRCAAVGAIASAQRQVEFITRDRDRIRAEAAEERVVFEAQIAALQARIVSLQNTVTLLRTESAADAVVLEAQVAALQAQIASLEDAAGKSPSAGGVSAEEEQRGQIVDLVSHLEAAQKRNRELTAQLADARTPGFSPAVSGVHERAEGSESASAAVVTTVAIIPNDALAQDLAAMQEIVRDIQIHNDRLDLLQCLYVQTMAFTERMKTMGLPAAACLAGAIAECLQWLHRTPNRISLDVLGSVEHGFDLLCFCAEAGVLDRLKDPASSVVYAVDDDPDNCECIGAALARFVDRTKYALRPSVALTELAGGEYDLILLDVNLPEMGGFELCRHIRTLDHHSRTPIIFLSGMGSAETRAQASESGGDDFIHKPFDLHELTVRALTQIMYAQL